MKPDLKKYKKYLDKEAEKFRLTQEDLSNLYDLFYMITPEINETLQLNKMDKWFHNLFSKLDKIVIVENQSEAKE